jgi:predicted esterase
MNRRLRLLPSCFAFVLSVGAAAAAFSIEIELKDGRVLRGKPGQVGEMNAIPLANPGEGTGPAPLIEFLDDDLRRTFFPFRLIKKPGGFRPEEAAEVLEKIMIPQRVMRMGPTVTTVGPLAKVEPFDEFARRTVVMVTPRAEERIVQGITVLTPTYAKVQAKTHVWDMRIATSGIPPDILAMILKKQIHEGTINDSKRIANFYVQCERYEEAAKELQAYLDAHSDDAAARQDLEKPLQAIKQLSAKRLLSELKLRRAAGQHRLVVQALQKFPTEGPAAETLGEVREILRQYETSETTRKQIFSQLGSIAKELGDESLRKRAFPVLREMRDELGPNTLDRLVAFRELAEDKAIPPSDKLALAISGWLLGSKAAVPRLSTAMSLVDVRQVIRKYLQSPDVLNRQQLISGFPSEEGASPAMVARLLANMTPPIAVEPPADESTPYEIEVPGPTPTLPAVRCLVQLPPEYDPHRRYPTIVSLHGPGYAPEQQLDWWAGPATKAGQRAGQATRQGYIVVAPQWAAEHQMQYEYSAREHAAVLDSLRAACQRFSIDTDRVFLSGHSTGGDAAWDIGAAHPDLWAGVIPIVARSDKYCAHYWKNAALLPFYFVSGELDSSRRVANSREWDRYLRAAFNTTVVEYQGRGHENFSDEILRIFEWMSHFKRNFAPKEFTTVTMRPWDNFFWWVELRQLPPRSMVAPDQWPLPRGSLPMTTKAGAIKPNGVQVETGAAQVTVWLSPDVVNLSQRVTVKVNGKMIPAGSAALAGDIPTMLEDARTRADRQHPFWSKVDSTTGRGAKD